jgi:hypothetical protein
MRGGGKSVLDVLLALLMLSVLAAELARPTCGTSVLTPPTAAFNAMQQHVDDLDSCPDCICAASATVVTAPATAPFSAASWREVVTPPNVLARPADALERPPA